jgi:pyruvate dehydrogenase E1 component alpha subunit
MDVGACIFVNWKPVKEETMQPDVWNLYGLMLYSRLFERAVTRLWEEGLISGEMHLGTGEEAVAAGIVSQLREGDAMALDHRGTPPMLMRGIDPVRLLRELLGCRDGLCSGMGGHMHLFSRDHLAASSGIVGATGPAGAGFALAAQILRPGSVAVAFFGEGALNQGMLLEALNLAVAWNLPVLFVCKDNQWAITTRSESVTGGSLLGRAHGFGIRASEVDGSEVQSVWEAARDSLESIRLGKGPAFIVARCAHLDGHFLGDPLLEMQRSPLKAARKRGRSLLSAFLKRPGAPFRIRLRSLAAIYQASQAIGVQASGVLDPLSKCRRELAVQDKEHIRNLEEETRLKVDGIVELALYPGSE